MFQFWPAVSQSISAFMATGIIGWLVGGALILYSATAVIYIALFGLRWQRRSLDETMQQEFMEKLIVMSLGFMMLQFYTVPMGTGFTFPKMITGTFDIICQQINQSNYENIITNLSAWQAALQTPSITNFAGIMEFTVVNIFIWIAEAAGFLMLVLSLIVTVVAIVFGPFFIAFLLVPKMEWMFWGWLKFFIQYASLKVTLAIIIAIMGNFLINVMNAIPHGSVAELAEYMPVVMVTLLAFIVVIWKSPEIHANLYSGSSGGSSGGGVIALIRGLF